MGYDHYDVVLAASRGKRACPGHEGKPVCQNTFVAHGNRRRCDDCSHEVSVIRKAKFDRNRRDRRGRGPAPANG